MRAMGRKLIAVQWPLYVLRRCLACDLVADNGLVLLCCLLPWRNIGTNDLENPLPWVEIPDPPTP
jgi:hypothetical protein